MTEPDNSSKDEPSERSKEIIELGWQDEMAREFLEKTKAKMPPYKPIKWSKID